MYKLLNSGMIIPNSTHTSSPSFPTMKTQKKQFKFRHIFLSISLILITVVPVIAQQSPYKWEAVPYKGIVSYQSDINRSTDSARRAFRFGGTIEHQGKLIGFGVAPLVKPIDSVTRETSILLESTDQGATWSILPFRFPKTPIRHYFYSMLEGHILYGLKETYYSTSDYGQTWNDADKEVFKNGSVPRISGRNKTLIASATSFFDIALSRDGGQSWKLCRQHDSTSQNPDLPYANYRAGVLDSTTFLVSRNYVDIATDRGLVFFKTTNSGITWNKLPSVTLDGVTTESGRNHNFIRMHFLDSRNGVALSWVEPRIDTILPIEVIMHTSDGGESWVTVDTNQGYHPRIMGFDHGFQQFGEDTVVSVLASSIVKISTDKGKTWSDLVDTRIEVEKNGVVKKPVFTVSIRLNSATSGYCYAGNLFQDTTLYIFKLVPNTPSTVKEDTVARSTLQSILIDVRGIYPNPSSTSLNAVTFVSSSLNLRSLKVTIYDICGVPVRRYTQEQLQLTPHSYGSGWYSINVDTRGIPNGMNIIEVSTPEYKNSSPFIHIGNE